jgi:hypothetical protein
MKLDLCEPVSLHPGIVRSLIMKTNELLFMCFFLVLADL